MASREFIEKRIAGKEKEISTLEKKLDRINKAKATNWEKNPYYYNERDITITEQELAAAKNALQKYKDDLAEEDNKAASRNVPALTEFLDQWEQHCIEFFEEEYRKYKEEQPKYSAERKQLIEDWNAARRSGNAESWKEIDKKERELDRKWRDRWAHVTQFNHGDKPWDETMRRDIAQEKIRKYDSLLDRVCHIVGTITDASGLKVGPKGELDGIVGGTDGKCQVQTIGAGGWNIQVFHYRVLVKPIK